MIFCKTKSLLGSVACGALLASIATESARAQEVFSATVGATAITVPASSDVFVALPFSQAARAGGSVASVSGDVVSLAASSLVDSAFDASGGAATHFLYIETGSLEGRFFDILSNEVSSITLGESAPAGLVDAAFGVREHWTLGSLFPEGIGGVSEDEAGRRAVELIMPEKASTGGGLAVERIFYHYDGAWREIGYPLDQSADDTVLRPGSALVVRNNAESALSFFLYGEVEYGPMAIPLVSSEAETIDNFVSVNRPLAISIDDLQLHDSPAFDAARDYLLIYPEGAGKLGSEKEPTVYVYSGGIWQVDGGDGLNVGSTLVENGQSIAVRKAAGTTATSYWTNEWNISQ